MVHLKLKTCKPATQKNNCRSYVAPICRRCGAECTCSEEELDAGGPA